MQLLRMIDLTALNTAFRVFRGNVTCFVSLSACSVQTGQAAHSETAAELFCNKKAAIQP